MNLITIIISIVIIDNMEIFLALITTIILSNIINWSSTHLCRSLLQDERTKSPPDQTQKTTGEGNMKL